MTQKRSGFAVRYVPEGKGIPGWLCDGGGDVVFVEVSGDLDALCWKLQSNLPGTVIGLFSYIDMYPDDAIWSPFYPDKALFDYA